MPPPLILRIITDASQTLKTNEAVIASNTAVGRSAIAMGASYEKSAALAGLSAGATAKTGAAAKEAERDLGKLTRGIIAGSGAASALGRSLAFASTGFIAVAGAATLVGTSIRAAEELAAAQRKADQQLRTSGKSWADYGTQIDAVLLKEGHLAGFTRTELLGAFTFLLRVGGNIQNSLKLTALAADVARGRSITLQAASIALSKALGGSVTALRRLGIVVPNNVSKMAALNYVQEKFTGQAAAGTTASDRLRASLTDAEATIGTQLLPTFERLATGFADWLTKMQESGRLTKDTKEIVRGLGGAFHFLGRIIGTVDDITGSFANTLKIIIAYNLVNKIVTGWLPALRQLAVQWGLVASSANAAAAAEARAATVAGPAAAAGAAGVAGAGAGIGAAEAGIGAGVVAARIAPYTMTGKTGQLMNSMRLAEARIPAALAVFSRMGVIFGRLIPAVGIAMVLLNQKVEESLAKLTSDVSKILKTPGSLLKGSTYSNLGTDLLRTDKSILNALPLHIGSIIGTATGIGPIADILLGKKGTEDNPIRVHLRPEIDQRNILSATAGGEFGPRGTGRRPARTSYENPLYIQIAQAQAELTQSTKDDVAVAKRIIKNIKRIIDRGNYTQKGLLDLLQAEAAALGVIQSAAQAAAQKRAAQKAAAEAAASTYEIPGYLQLAQAKAEAYGKDETAILKKIIAAAEAAIRKGGKNWKGLVAAYQAIGAARAALAQRAQDALIPLRLQLRLAKAQALGTDQTGILLKMRAALYKALKAAKGNIQRQIDIWNQIAQINDQLGNSITNAYGDYKKASLKAETEGLGLTAAQRRLLEARLSQRGPGGTVPSTGIGAAGYIIDPETGRPVRVRRGHHPGRSSNLPGTGGGGGGMAFTLRQTINVNIDGKRVARVITKHQQTYRSQNPSSRRGPHAATATA